MQILRKETLSTVERSILQQKQKIFWKNLTFLCLLFTAVAIFFNFGFYWLDDAPMVLRMPTILEYLCFIFFVYQYLYPIYLQREQYTKDLTADEKIIAEFVVRSKEKSYLDKTFSIKTLEAEPFYSFDISQEQYDAISIGTPFCVAYSFHSKTVLEIIFYK